MAAVSAASSGTRSGAARTCAAGATAGIAASGLLAGTRAGMRRRPSKLARAIRACVASVAALTMLAGLTACDSVAPKPQVDANTAPKLVISEDQEKKIRAEILKDISAANDSQDPSGLGERVADPELSIRGSQLTVLKYLKANKADKVSEFQQLMEIPDSVRQVVIPKADGWPRSIVTITDNTDSMGSPRLLVIDQSNARDNYKLWGVVRLFSGATLPKFPVPTVGAQQGTDADTDLVATPKEAVNMYADVLANGSNSQYAGQVADDSLRQTVQQLTDTVQQGVAGNKGTQQQTFAPVDGQIRVMHATGGGALVVAQIQSVWERTGGEGRESRPASDAETALFGGGKPTSTMRVTYSNVVALFVPASGQGQIQAVGAERQPIKVEAL